MLSLSEPWSIIEFGVLFIAAVIIALKEYGENLPTIIIEKIPAFFKSKRWAAVPLALIGVFVFLLILQLLGVLPKRGTDIASPQAPIPAPPSDEDEKKMGALQSQIAKLSEQLSATAQERDDLRRKSQTSPQPQIKAGIDLNQYSRKICFDYSTNDGVIKVTLNAITFEIHFTKGNNESIYIYKDGTNLRAIASLRGVNPGDDIDFSEFDSSSRYYTVSLGGYFIAQNVDGYFLLARILSIKDDTRGYTNDEVCFAYSIDTSKSGRFKAL